MSDIHVAMVEARKAGRTYRQIGAQFGIHKQTARKLFLRFLKEGIEAIQKIGSTVNGPRPGISSEEYNRRWIERVRAKCEIDARGCWLWKGFLGHKGYGGTTYRSRNVILHRQMYQIVHGVTLATEQLVCHKCDIRNCCNPEHLWLGDALSNMRDKNAKGRNYFANQTHCKRGHEFTPENTRRYESKPGVMSRGCKTCERERFRSPEYVAWRRAYQKQRRAKLKAARRNDEHP